MANHNHISSPIHTFRHPEHRNHVTLIGTCHLAEPEYFDTIQNITNEQHDAGAAVHYERVRCSSPHAEATAPRLVQRNVRLLRQVTQGADQEVAEMLGLVHQSAALTYPDTWENHDISELVAASYMNTTSLFVLAKLAKLSAYVASRTPTEVRAQEFLAAMQFASRSTELPNMPFFGSLFATTRTRRNDIALAAADQELQNNPATDLTLLWGSDHLAGLGEGFEARGFEKIDEQAIVAIHLPEI